MNEGKFKRFVCMVLYIFLDAFIFIGCAMFILIVFSEISSPKEDDKKISGHSITVTSNGHEYIIFKTDKGNTCCTHSESCPCHKTNTLWNIK